PGRHRPSGSQTRQHHADEEWRKAARLWFGQGERWPWLRIGLLSFDTRTDIFAFGAVLYEMLTGKKAFDGKSQAVVIAAILEHNPTLTTSLPIAPPALDRIIKRCVAKDPDGRWQSAGDLTS